jgi:hypothetical protein
MENFQTFRYFKECQKNLKIGGNRILADFDANCLKIVKYFGEFFMVFENVDKI